MNFQVTQRVLFWFHVLRKYKRFEKRHKNISAHLSPCFRDIAIGECVQSTIVPDVKLIEY